MERDHPPRPTRVSEIKLISRQDKSQQQPKTAVVRENSSGVAYLTGMHGF